MTEQRDLGPAPPEPPISRDRAELHPLFVEKLALLEEAMLAEALPVYLVEGYRSRERQDWLYGWGRSWGTAGKVKTQRDGSRLVGHLLGLAADLCARGPAGKPWYPAKTHRFWRRLGHHAERIELVWGGRYGAPEPSRQKVASSLSPKEIGWDAGHVELPSAMVADVEGAERPKEKES